MKKVLFALILSVFVHLLLATGILVFPVPPVSKNSGAVEIEITETQKPSQKENSKQIVREALAPDQIKTDDSDDSLRFWSAQTQRVKKQSRAAEIGRTENRSEQRPQNRTQEQSLPGRRNPLNRKELIAAATEATKAGLSRPSPTATDRAHNELPSLANPGSSTVGESLPEDIQVGSFTALNTDRYLYYSFYSRVEDLIRFRWESAVQHALDTTAKERLSANIRNRWVTQMEVLLNEKGELQKVVILKQSGLPAFDQAATRAFSEARYFPNPPIEMMEEDGLIHLKYSFTVYYDPRLLARP